LKLKSPARNAVAAGHTEAKPSTESDARRSTAIALRTKRTVGDSESGLQNNSTQQGASDTWLERIPRTGQHAYLPMDEESSKEEDEDFGESGREQADS
jgi:hypothetical protein